MANKEIRRIIFENNLRHYAVAEAMNISEFTFCKWMRSELTEERREMVMQAINKLISQK